MAEYADNMADPPPWADTMTDQVIRADSIGPIPGDLASRLGESDGHAPQPVPEAT